MPRNDERLCGMHRGNDESLRLRSDGIDFVFLIYEPSFNTNHLSRLLLRSFDISKKCNGVAHGKVPPTSPTQIFVRLVWEGQVIEIMVGAAGFETELEGYQGERRGKNAGFLRYRFPSIPPENP